MTPGIGTKTAVQLIDRFKTPQRVFRASLSELQAAGVSGSVARSVTSGCAFDDAVTQQQKMLECGARLIPITHPKYPKRLKEVFDPPPMLFARGRLELLGSLGIGVVGTRRPTAYGTAAATRLATDLSEAGLTIISGMARGIDTSAHKAVLEANGDTIAVFGCGVDELYPAENRKLADDIILKGLVLSDFPMGMPPYPQNFPLRNRIVSGMSAGVLVVEGGQYSGSAITAKLATEQGREVFAVPGNITSKLSWGPNLLIKQGAKLIQDWNDVVVELKPEDRRWLVRQCRSRLNLNEIPDGESNSSDQASEDLQTKRGTGQTAATLDIGPMSDTGRAILAEIGLDIAVPLDTLMDKLVPTSPSEILAVLFELELNGMVRQLPGKSYIKVWLE
ncbi:MAG: DNA-processing protein DprA [Acidobacteriota bacterium]